MHMHIGKLTYQADVQEQTRCERHAVNKPVCIGPPQRLCYVTLVVITTPVISDRDVGTSVFQSPLSERPMHRWKHGGVSVDNGVALSSIEIFCAQLLGVLTILENRSCGAMFQLHVICLVEPSCDKGQVLSEKGLGELMYMVFSFVCVPRSTFN